MSVGISKDRHEVHALHALSNGTGSSTFDNTSGTYVSRHPVKCLEGSSREDARHSSIWKRPATIIAKPTDRRPIPPQKASGCENPYSRMTDTLARGNPSTLTLVPTDRRIHHASSRRSGRPPAHKKLKLDHGGTSYEVEGPISNSSRLAPSVVAGMTKEIDEIFSSQRKSKHRPNTLSQGNPSSPPSTTSEIIDVDEDVGIPVLLASESSDDLQLRHGERPGENHIEHTHPSVQEILEVSPPSVQHPFNCVRKRAILGHPPPRPGPKTNALISRIGATETSHVSGNGNEADPIEDTDGLVERYKSPEAVQRKRKATPSGRTDFEVGYVNKAVKHFSEKAEPFNMPIPEVNLYAKTRKTGKLISSMKTKDNQNPMITTRVVNARRMDKSPPGTRASRKRSDVIAASSTHFRGADVASGSETEYALPVETLVCGQLAESAVGNSIRHWICVRGEKVSIVNHPIDSPKRTLMFEFVSGHDISGAIVPAPGSLDDCNKYPILGFLVNRTKNSEFLFKDQDKELQDLAMHMRISTEHAGWDVRVYQNMVKALSSSPSRAIKLLPPPAVQGYWEFVQRSVEHSPVATISKPKPRPAYVGARVSSEELTGSATAASAPWVRRSSRNSSSAIGNIERPYSPPVDETILLYPPTGTGVVNVTRGDLKRLEPGEYLNDTLIELGLKLWLNELKDTKPEFADQVHVFSSFFYTQLNHKNIEEGYQSVRKWTSKFDLFKKNYIIVPINEHLHWYLAIICFPDRALHQPVLMQPVTPNVTTRNQLREALSKSNPFSRLRRPRRMVTLPPINSGSASVSSASGAVDQPEMEETGGALSHALGSEAGTPPSSPWSTLTLDMPNEEIVTDAESDGEKSPHSVDVPMKVDSLSPRPTSPPTTLCTVPPSAFYASTDVTMRIVEKEGRKEEKMDLSDSDHDPEVDGPSPVIEPAEAAQPDRPYIFSFDSLGARHPHALKLLSRYLDMEAKDKKYLSQTTTAITKQASVPTQPNYCDCGVYLLHFVEQFMSDPEVFTRSIADHRKSKKCSDINRQERELMWNHGAVMGKRENLKQMILSLSSQWKREKETEGKEKGKGEDQTGANQTKNVVDDDSDIEVLDITPEPNRTVKGSGPRVPAQHKAQRIR